eukprot:6190788-Pleurochrysis_carterae.AAC.3
MLTLSSANSYSYGRRKQRLSEYMQQIDNVDWRNTPSDQIFYFFGEHAGLMDDLLEKYAIPGFANADSAFLHEEACDARPPALSFGIAGNDSGVPFHFHNDVRIALHHHKLSGLFVLLCAYTLRLKRSL